VRIANDAAVPGSRTPIRGNFSRLLRMGGDRPRGHTSLTGAVDVQLAVKRDNAGIITVKVEWLKDGQEGAEIVSRLE
jgi:hypothetical protein